MRFWFRWRLSRGSDSSACHDTDKGFHRRWAGQVNNPITSYLFKKFQSLLDLISNCCAIKITDTQWDRDEYPISNRLHLRILFQMRQLHNPYRNSNCIDEQLAIKMKYGGASIPNWLLCCNSKMESKTNALEICKLWTSLDWAVINCSRLRGKELSKKRKLSLRTFIRGHSNISWRYFCQFWTPHPHWH